MIWNCQCKQNTDVVETILNWIMQILRYRLRHSSAFRFWFSCHTVTLVQPLEGSPLLRVEFWRPILLVRKFTRLYKRSDSIAVQRFNIKWMSLRKSRRVTVSWRKKENVAVNWVPAEMLWLQPSSKPPSLRRSWNGGIISFSSWRHYCFLRFQSLYRLR